MVIKSKVFEHSDFFKYTYQNILKIMNTTTMLST